MITVENINAVEGLNGLTDEQKTAIITLATASENDAKNALYSEIHSGIDKIVGELTGSTKGGTEKTTEYLTRILTESVNKGKTDAAEIARLNETISKGTGNAELKTQYDQAIADRDNARKDSKKYKEMYDNAVEEGKKELFSYRVNAAIAEAMGSLTFNSNMPEELLALAKQNVAKEVASLNPFFTEDGKLIFRNADGVTLMDEKGAYAPHTAKTLLQERLGKYGVLSSTTAGMGGNNSIPGIPSLGGAKTRAEAYAFIEKQLAEKGIAVGSLSYTTEKSKLLQQFAADLAKLN